jgi:hypothetical protein
MLRFLSLLGAVAVLLSLIAARPAAAVDQWTVANVTLVQTYTASSSTGSSYGHGLFSNYATLICTSDSVHGVNTGTSAAYDIEVGRWYTKVGSPPALTISLTLDVDVYTSALGGFFSSGDGYADGTSQSQNLGTGVATATSYSLSTGAWFYHSDWGTATASDSKSATYQVKARLVGNTYAHSAGPNGEGHGDTDYSHVSFSNP